MKPQFLSTIKGTLHLLRGITWVDWYKKWLNRLPEDKPPTKLTTKFDFDQKLENDDVEEEFILQMEMEKLMIDDFQNDDESSEDEVSEICTIPV